MGHETRGRVRGYGDLVAPEMVPWVQQTQPTYSVIRRSRKGREYASLQFEFIALKDMCEKQSKKIEDLRHMIQSSQQIPSSHNSVQSSNQHWSSLENHSLQPSTRVIQHQQNTQPNAHHVRTSVLPSCMPSQQISSNLTSEQSTASHRSSSENQSLQSPTRITQHQLNAPSNMQHNGTSSSQLYYPQAITLRPNHFPPSSQLYYPQACHPSSYPQMSYLYGEYTALLNGADFMQPINNRLDQGNQGSNGRM